MYNLFGFLINQAMQCFINIKYVGLQKDMRITLVLKNKRYKINKIRNNMTTHAWFRKK